MPRITVSLISVPIGSYLSDISTAGLQCIQNTKILFIESRDGIVARLLRKGIITANHQLIELNKDSLAIAQEFLQNETSFAILADSGNPCFVDPGYDIVAHILDEWLDEVHLMPIGMSSALDAALSMAGIDIQMFIFAGHYPEYFDWNSAQKSHPIIFYVAGKAIVEWLEALPKIYPDQKRITLFRNIRNRLGEKIYRFTKNNAPPEISNNPSDNYVAIIELNKPAQKNTKSKNPHRNSYFFPTFCAEAPYSIEMSLLIT